MLLAEQRPLDAIAAYEDALRFQSGSFYWEAFFGLMSLRVSLQTRELKCVRCLRRGVDSSRPLSFGSAIFSL